MTRLDRLSRRTFLVFGAATVLSACATTVPPMPARATSSRPEDLTRDDFLAAINATRRANGAGAWRYSPALESAARTQARLMASKDTMSHNLGSTLRERVTEAGYSTAVGENVAKGYTSLPAVIEGWLGSTGHRNTLLSQRFTEFGLAVARSGSGKLYWAMVAGGSFEAWYS
jgi:uncharacterized protein YkwD